ncbi:MAG: peptidase domain-containing ABC transporter [Bacteroidales bacterium]|jgi:ATP-binding cassette subfamily B protein|nr:peptidase domain-containing ABC transporter [Bacteroidales bacterium]
MKFIPQLDSMDCGIACLCMIADHYGCKSDADFIRQFVHKSKRGVSLLGISDAAQELGFKTVGGRISMEQLEKVAPLPCIVHWQQEHFIVVHKITTSLWKRKKFIHIADPGKGFLKLSEKEFKEGWFSSHDDGKGYGVVLLFETSSDIKRKNLNSNKQRKIEKLHLSQYFLRYKKYFFQLFLGLILASLFQLTLPFLTQSVVDIGITNQNIKFIYLVLIAQLTITLSRLSVDFIQRWILLHIGTRINLSLISDFFIKLMRLPMSFFDTSLVGDLTQRIQDHQRIQSFLTTQSLSIFFSVINFVVFSLVLLLYSLKIFLILLLFSVLYTVWIILFLKKRKYFDYKFFEQHSQNQDKTLQLIHGMQEIKLQNCEDRKRWEWEDVQADIFETNVKSMRIEQIREVGSVFINESKNIIITIIAATSVIYGDLTLGMMLAVQYIVGQLNSPIDNFVQFIHNFQSAKISLDRVNSIHTMEDENEQKKIISTEFANKSIIINNLTFQYEGKHSPKVLNDINLIIKENTVTAIVGASGSGKTTLIKLLLQYYKPIEGKIEVDNIDLQDIHTNFWRRNCGVVMQDGFIFSNTIAENISISDEEIDENRLIFAAQTANIHDFVLSLPLRYNTIIGNEGQSLSQGQKQRILIARAIYKNPNFLFFDEATNALDANNEQAIVKNLQDFYKGKTVVVVAHRLSTVKNADKIVVLEKGKIIETGTHNNLTELKGAYYELVKNQLELGN